MKGYVSFGKNIDPAALKQMDDALSLPISVKGALMPDAHLGYGLPIGGVLATDNAVIPYAVGVDIACRMRISIVSTSVSEYQKNRGIYKIALEKETMFGVGKEFSKPKQHKVMDEDWSFCKQVKSLKDKAYKQLGTSGAGNHFAEFGTLTVTKEELGLKKGEYLAFLTHSGSRGTGADIAKYYSSLAKKMHNELPKSLHNLAWLGMDKEEGQEYFKAMELMGKYSSANHEIIHNSVLNYLGEEVLCFVENHHNFAFKEKIGNREYIVHRKGATPAQKGVLGVIPGSMASPGFIVRGKGNELSINSAAHGAGRKMSRKAAKKQLEFKDLNKLLKQKQVTLISAGLDEAPMAYKNIEEIMDQQKDLVEIIARFDPRLVKMAPAGRKKKNYF
ncbi:MAG: RtcB family protein [Desulfobacteraceae bacterium]|nr:RtcB family protein [Desulfobacteraceae bacterium]